MGGYMQQLIEAVNASNATTFLDWAPIILSVISVLIAVYIPVKLARKENQIAIFEKLYAAYSQLLAVRAFADCIKAYKFTGESKVLKRRENCIAYTLKQVSAIGRFYQKQGERRESTCCAEKMSCKQI